MSSRRFFLGLLACVVGLLPLVPNAATNEPPVHLLVPGFTVQELPVKLSNQNNLRFAPDGTLTSLGYDGKVWRLRDTNGDGLEDTAEPFWDQPTLSVPLGMAWSTHGLYVSSKGKVSLLRDTNSDGRADTEEVIASGWPATDVGSGGVDATAVTLDKEGNLFFGLLVADYSNAYRLRKRSELKPAEVEWLKQNARWKEPVGTDAANDEFSLYDLNSKRGTIQKFDPRTKKLETVATGLRVPVALAFNREGDLFNTDQEGETWMPNGNPLDELNHIIPGRNYGFPPRHEKWLPDLVSEPPVVGFGPQHQSACGLVFNEVRGAREVQSPKFKVQGSVPLPAAPAQGLFGPKWWEGDAFVAGESRGKIWRVRLVKTPHGYVGRSYTIARLSMLTLDLAISPKGDLYVCCHSGPPDWGTGPQGEGKIFKISYTDPSAPQPVAVWPASPTEVRIAFDRPLDPSATNAFNVGRASHLPRDDGLQQPQPARGDQQAGETPALPYIEFGEYVSAGDRFEVLKPPYAVVEQQDATPRGKLAIRNVRLVAEGNLLVLDTDPHPLAVDYTLSLLGISAKGRAGSPATLELQYDLTGAEWQQVQFEYRDPTGTVRLPTKSVTLLQRFGYQPVDFERLTNSLLSLDSTMAAALSRGSPLLEDLHREAFAAPPHLSKFAARLPPGTPTNLLLISPTFLGGEEGSYTSETTFRTGPDLKLEMTFSGTDPNRWFRAWRKRNGGSLSAAWGDSDQRPVRAVTPEQLLQIWAPTNRASAGTDSRPAPKPQGDWEHGRELFAGTALNCAKCHRVRGEGGLAGPDLSNLIHRDARSVERDIREPGATLHPDYVTYLAELKGGDSLTGFIRSQGDDAIRLFDADGKDTVIARADLANLHPTGQSLMPTGLLDTLKPDDVRDLLTFLLWEPPVRSRADVAALAKARSEGSPPNRILTNAATLRIVLVASKQDHGPGQHDYPRWQEKWLRLLSALGSSRHEEAQTSGTASSSPGQENVRQPSASVTVPLSPGERAGVRAGQSNRPEPAPSSSFSSQSLLTSAPTGSGVQVETAWEWPSPEQFTTADVLVFYYWNHDWNEARYAQLDAFQQRGGGVVILHSACIADRDAGKLAERIGLSAQPDKVGYRHMPFDLKFIAKDHPLTHGLPEWLHFLDEPYWPLIGDPKRVNVLAVAPVDGVERPLVWTFEKGKGRVFGSILGHYFWTLDDPLYRVLVLRAIAWTGRADVERLKDAALLEAALK